MDNKGFIFTLDSALALVSLLIVLSVVAHISDAQSTYSSQQIRISHDAQDTLETMATYKSSLEGFTVLQNITNTLIANNNDATGVAIAGQIASLYLNKTLGSAKYNLTEINQLNTTIVANSNMKNANNIAVGIRSYDDYTFKLYIWN